MTGLASLCEEVLASPELVANPPILVDVGASGGIHAKWNGIASSSICLAFDPDSRLMGPTLGATSRFRRLHVCPSVVADTADGTVDFYLTSSPACSSTLRPRPETLEHWAFSDLFRVEDRVTVPATTLAGALHAVGLSRIDWIKLDTQGTDLRILRSLCDDVLNRTLTIELEPGILDAYQGEDKLHHVMAFMESRPFWMSSIAVQGAYRARMSTLGRALSTKDGDALARMTQSSPGWAELTYTNTLQPWDRHTKRDFLLAWLFAVEQRQFGFAAELAITGSKLFPSSDFDRLVRETVATARRDEARQRPTAILDRGKSYLRRQLGRMRETIHA